jgi:hypothetical protein
MLQYIVWCEIEQYEDYEEEIVTVGFGFPGCSRDCYFTSAKSVEA